MRPPHPEDGWLAGVVAHPSLRSSALLQGAQDSRAKERAWKLFGLVPVMLLHRPRGTGSIGKDELVSRADDFVRGRWIDLLENIDDISRQPRPAMCETQEHERTGLETLAQLQERRPQERVREFPREVWKLLLTDLWNCSPSASKMHRQVAPIIEESREVLAIFFLIGARIAEAGGACSALAHGISLIGHDQTNTPLRSVRYDLRETKDWK